MKRLLLLGGSIQQIPAIQYAKSRGYFTVLCDYLPDNYGQKYADQYYCVSTTDKEKVLRVATKEIIDGVVAYASDPAAPTAAYVAEIMGLPTNPLQAVEILTDKGKFREFLKSNGFNHPNACTIDTSDQISWQIQDLNFPVIAKPVDSSGSKGVSIVHSIDELFDACQCARVFSRNGIVLIEEYIEKDHEHMIGGDCFVLNGQVQFWGLLNSHRDLNLSPLIPVGTSYPVAISKSRIDRLMAEVQRVVDILGFKFGAINLEILFDRHDQLYLIEMGPRSGGNMIPDLLQAATGVDTIAATIETALNQHYTALTSAGNKVFLANYVLHAAQSGMLRNIHFSDSIRSRIVKKVMYKQVGDSVVRFENAGGAIGVVFFEFDSELKMHRIMNEMGSHISLQIEP